MADKKAEIKKAASKKADSKKAAKNKKPNAFKRLIKYLGSCKGEIKKITWPDRKTVLKNTGVVLVSVAAVCVVIFAIDQGLSFLIELLVKLAKKTGENAETAAAIMNLINLG